MSVVATDYSHYSNLVKASDSDNTKLFHELVTVNEAAQKSYVVGTALGKVTATGKWKISVQNAADGSQNVLALVVGDSFGTAAPFTVAATTDTKVLVLARGKVIVSKGAIVFDASYDLDAEKQAAYDSLKTVNILAEATV
jgi:hypothetical protein